jgi:peptidoglycan/LPS O-acetylase OafA/YrhL
MHQAEGANYEPHIDAVRGAMAMWVFAFHASVLCGFTTRLIPSGAIAVDVFMFISGLLMTRNFLAREHREPIGSPQTIVVFLTKRFFRIAPLYYPLLFVALIFWFDFARMMDEAYRAFPPAWSDLLPNDPSQRELTLTSIAAHLTFVFGIFPQYASNNAVPDWSISLEMQFYLALPLILLAIRRFGLTTVVICLMLIQALIVRYVGIGLNPGKLGLWPQPSMLPFKINCFMAGVTMAEYLSRRSMVSLVLTFLLMFWGERDEFSVIVLFCFLAMLDQSEVPFRRIISFIKATISGGLGNSSEIFPIPSTYSTCWCCYRSSTFFLALSISGLRRQCCGSQHFLA